MSLLYRQLMAAPSLAPAPTPIVFPEPDNYEPLTLPCKFYNNGRSCPRERKGYCPYVHDMNVRKESLERKRFERSRQNQQQQYNAAKAGAGRPAPLSQNVPKQNGTLKKRTNSRCLVPTSNVQHGVAQCNTPKPNVLAPTIIITLESPQRICQKFLSSHGCKMREQCPAIHDFELRKARRAEKRMSKIEKDNAGLNDRSPKSKGQNNMNADSLNTNMASTSSGIIPAPVPQVPLIIANKTWDIETRRAWAIRNLRPETLDKYLATKSYKDEVPTKMLSPEKTPGSVKFENFRFLPGEIRNQIWGHVLDEERFQCRIKFNHDGYHDGHYFRAGFEPQNAAPRLLHVNRETRSLALERYEYTFGTETAGPACFFNYKNDRLFIHSRGVDELRQISKTFVKRDIWRIKNLSVPLRDYIRNPLAFQNAMARFKGIKHLWLVVGNGREDACCAEDPKMVKKVEKVVLPYWRRYNAGKRVPIIKLEVIDALEAHALQIDGLIY